MNGNEEESNWDSLLADLGLENASEFAAAPAPPVPAHIPAPVKPPPPPIQPKVREEGFEVVPARVAEIEMKAAVQFDDANATEFGAGIVEDGADVLDDEAPEGTEGAAEGQAEGDGKGRRRRRRRRRKKGAPGDAAVAEGAVPAVPELSIEGEELALAESRDEASAAISDAPVEETADEDDEVEEIVPEFAGVEEELEDDSTEPLPEWKVTAWTELVATLYRPQDR